MIKFKNGGYIMERADKEAELKKHIDRLDYAMGEVRIALNILREHYGLDVICVRMWGSPKTKDEVHLGCGIDELAQVLGRQAKLNTNCRATKDFKYLWTEYCQVAEQNSMDFLPLNYRGKALYRLDDEVKNND